MKKRLMLLMLVVASVAVLGLNQISQTEANSDKMLYVKPHLVGGNNETTKELVHDSDSFSMPAYQFYTSHGYEYAGEFHSGGTLWIKADKVGPTKKYYIGTSGAGADQEVVGQFDGSPRKLYMDKDEIGGYQETQYDIIIDDWGLIPNAYYTGEGYVTTGTLSQ